MKFLISTALMLLSLNLFAEAPLLTITNDVDTNVVTIEVEQTDGKLTGLHKVERNAKGEVVDDKHPNLIALYKGAPIEIKKGREVVKIRIDKDTFDTTYGGTIILDFLTNGISGNRDNLEVDLRKNGSKWEVAMDGKVTRKMFVKGKTKLVVGLIGISSISRVP
jgi:hypothetical protein